MVGIVVNLFRYCPSTILCICFELLPQLDPSLSLKQRCIAGTGMVQICVELKCDETPPRLNITDVLQPPQDLYGANGWLSMYFSDSTSTDWQVDALCCLSIPSSVKSK